MPHRRKPKRILYATYWWLEDQMSCVASEAVEYGWYLDFQMCISHRLPDRWRGDGIITTLSGGPAEMAAFLARTNCPAVSLNQYHPEIDIPCVGMDLEQAGQMAAEHFIERRFRQLAHFTRQRWEDTQLAYLPFEEAAMATGCSVHSLLWPRDRGCRRDSWENRHQWLRGRLRECPRPLGVLAIEPLAAVEVIEAAMEEELSVPEDVAVLGLFDIGLFRQCTTVPLSCIVQDFTEQVRVACDLLGRMMDGEPVSSEKILLPPGGITARQSSDIIAAYIPEVAKALRYMQNNYDAPIDVPRIARVCGLSRTRLYELFDEDLGESPHAMLTRIRVDKAKQMLIETKESIQSVAEACGFGDHINLYRQFKRRLNVTPSAFRSSGSLGRTRGAELPSG